MQEHLYRDKNFTWQLSNSFSQEDKHRYYRWIKVIIVATLLIFGTALNLQPEANEWFIKESGLIESMSAAGYILCVITMMTLGRDPYLRKMWYFPVLLLAFAMRELDLHNRYTEFSILSSKFYLRSQDSILTKSIAVAIVLFVVFAAYCMLRQHLPGLRERLRQRLLTPIDWSIIIATGFMFTAKSIDGLGRKLGGLGIEISEKTDSIAAPLEESMEWAIPYLFITAVIIYFAQLKTRPSTRSSP